MSVSSPVITSMQVIPVAGYDSMLMTLSGAHAPCFTRNIVILKDSAGHTGIGEIHGGDAPGVRPDLGRRALPGEGKEGAGLGAAER